MFTPYPFFESRTVVNVRIFYTLGNLFRDVTKMTLFFVVLFGSFLASSVGRGCRVHAVRSGFGFVGRVFLRSVGLGRSRRGRRPFFFSFGLVWFRRKADVRAERDGVGVDDDDDDDDDDGR